MKALLFALFLLLPTCAVADAKTLSAVNELRAQHGRSALVWDDRLARAAERHAADMVAENYFSHTAPDGSGLGDRLQRSGYRACFAAENIAQGQDGLAAVLAAWMNSQGHRKNILHRKATAIGLAKARGATWVMVLASPC